MTTASFLRFASLTATTTRNPAPAGGKVSAPVTNLSNVRCTPPEPISPEIAQLFSINSPRESKVTYVDGALDIKESDQMVINSVTYRVQAVGEFTGAQSVLQVILSEVK